MSTKIVTCIAPVNIAVIKYWGKRDEDLILPLNDSLSLTLSIEHMCSTTTIMASPNFKENKLWLNGKEESTGNKRFQKCLEAIRKEAVKSIGKQEFLTYNIHVCSENNFPTAAGLASSAAGYACLVYTLAKLYGVTGNISKIARLGSGSACRSIFGGFVQWCAGSNPSGEDSLAVQIEPETYWPEMKVLILVVNDSKKKVSSTSGMSTSVLTSELLKYRVAECVPKRIDEIKEAIRNKDFEQFAEITMKDSNQFHAVCLDTYPPCVYMNDISHSVVEFVHKYNIMCGQTKVAYTFDAGPNACLYLLEDEVPDVISLINVIFPTSYTNEEYLKGIPLTPKPASRELVDELNMNPLLENDALKYIIYTEGGPGPCQIEKHLLDNDGIPRRLV
ncbi:diphosphomevalonate decarboxylase [Ctenocephalides felis]|uniref:diphosphomevalonate decarboxylase n=1 Tax=Ctenocephalides felis TaxID=7515 RepID=UPI000E6E2150|nr:diphosphomevalonate decarboxylase [Ctenocephalides felis]